MSDRERAEREPECRRIRELVAQLVPARSRRSFPEASPFQQINRQIGGVESFTAAMPKFLFEDFC